MATKTLYILGTAAVTPNFFGNMQDGGTAPTAANSAFGWSVNKMPVGFYKAFLGATAAAATTQAGSYISGATGPTKGTGSGATTAGDSFVSPTPYTGTFAAGAWTLSLNLRAATAGCVGHLNMRVWASVNADGSSARELTSGSLVGSAVTLSTTADVNGMGTTTWSPAAITLNNEYLFFQLEWQETTLGTTNGDNVAFRVNTALITTTNFSVTWQGAAAFSGAGGFVSPRANLLAGAGSQFNGAGGLVAGATHTPTGAAAFAGAGGLGADIALSWLPTIVGVTPLFYADFTTEGGSNHYWYNGAKYGGAAAFLAATGATQTRTTPGSRTNASGFVEQVASGVLRFDYDPVTLASRGIRLEGQSSNLLQQWNDPTAGGWLNAGLPATQVLTGPDGVANSGWKMTEDTGTQHVAINTTGATVNGSTYTASFYVKNGTGRHVLLAESVVSGAAIEVDPSTGTIVAANGGVTASSIKPAGNGWYRCSMTFVSTSTANAYLDLYSYNGGTSYTGDGVSWWGFYGLQLEPLPLASSPIPTTTAALSRFEDVLTFPLAASQGTYLVAIFAKDGMYSTLDGYLSSNTNNFAAQGTGGTATVRTTDGLRNLETTCNDTLTSPNVFGVSGDPNSTNLCANGGAVVSDANRLFYSPPSSQISLINNVNAPWCFGNWRMFAAWPTAIATPAQLQTLTQSLPAVASLGAFFAGAGGLSADATVLPGSTGTVWSGAAEFDGAGGLAAAAVHTPAGAALFSGAGALVADTIHAPAGAAQFSGSGGLAAAASHTPVAAAQFSGSGALAADSIHAPLGAAKFSGSGSLVVDAGHSPAGAAAFSGQGGLLVDSFVIGHQFGTAVLAGSGGLVVDATHTPSAAALFAGAGALRVDAFIKGMIQASASLSGVGGMAAAAGVLAQTGAGFAGAGVLRANARVLLAGTARFTASGGLAAAAQLTLAATATFAGAGGFAAAAQLTSGASAIFAGAGGFQADATTLRYLPAVASGNLVSSPAKISGTNKRPGVSLSGDVIITVPLFGETEEEVELEGTR